MTQPYDLLVPYMKQLLYASPLFNPYIVDEEEEYTRPEGSKSIRFDVRVPVADVVMESSTDITDIILCEIAEDLADLAVNGDTDSNDPWLRNFDGEVKLGKRFKSFSVTPRKIYREYVANKDSIEYTVFAIIKGELDAEET